MLIPKKTTIKHQARAPSKVISGVFAIHTKALPTKDRATTTVTRLNRVIPRNDMAIIPNSGFSKLG